MRTETRETTIYNFPKTTAVVKKTSGWVKKLWKLAKPSIKKLVQKVIVFLHEVVNKLEVYLLSKIDEVDMEPDFPIDAIIE